MFKLIRGCHYLKNDIDIVEVPIKDAEHEEYIDIAVNSQMFQLDCVNGLQSYDMYLLVI